MLIRNGGEEVSLHLCCREFKPSVRRKAIEVKFVFLFSIIVDDDDDDDDT